MDESAIKRIQESFYTTVHSLNEAVDDLGCRVIPDGMQLESIQKFLPHRRFFHAKIATAYIAEFGRLVNNRLVGVNEGDETYCFIDPDVMKAKAIFDLGDTELPGHGKFQAILNLEQTAAYSSVLAINGDRISQRRFVEWLEDWRENITGIYGDDDTQGTIGKVIADVRRIDIKHIREMGSEENHFSTKKTAMEKIGADSDLPSYIVFNCNPYHGLLNRPIYMRVNMNIDRDGHEFTLTLVQEDRLREEIAEEFKDTVMELFDIDKRENIYIGTITLD